MINYNTPDPAPNDLRATFPPGGTPNDPRLGANPVITMPAEDFAPNGKYRYLKLERQHPAKRER